MATMAPSTSNLPRLPMKFLNKSGEPNRKQAITSTSTRRARKQRLKIRMARPMQTAIARPPSSRTTQGATSSVKRA